MNWKQQKLPRFATADEVFATSSNELEAEKTPRFATADKAFSTFK